MATAKGSRLAVRLDRWVGSPVLRALGACRTPRARPANPRRVAVVKADGLGDLALATGLLRSMRAAWPDARIVLLCGPSNAALARLLRVVDETIELPLANPVAALERARLSHPDLVADLGQWTRFEALLAWATGAYSVGFSTPGQYRHYAIDCPVAHRRDRHELENYAAVAEALGLVPDAPALDLELPEPVEKPPAGAFVVFHGWASGTSHSALKEWPTERWAELAARCASRGLSVVLSGGPRDADSVRGLAAACARKGVAVHAKGGSSLVDTIHLLEGAQAVVSVNTGIMHLAAVLGRPTVGLHGPTDARRWGPRGPRALAVSAPGTGCGYLNLGWEYPLDAAERGCMEAITVAAVDAALRAVLEPR